MSEAQFINPLLPLPPSSDGPSRPMPPRKTYGRVRAATPTDDVPSFVTAPSAITSKLPVPSPAKALLNRFSSNSSGFLNGLADLAADMPSDETEEELLAFVQSRKRQLAKTKNPATQAPGPSASSAKATLPVPSLARTQRAVFGGSSSLTDIPSADDAEPENPTSPLSDAPPSAAPRSSTPRSLSKTPRATRVAPAQSTPPPSSPPLASSELVVRSVPIPPERPSTADDEETFPIRRTGTAKTAVRRRVVASSDEEDVVASRPLRNSPSPSPRRAPPTPMTAPPSRRAKSSSLTDPSNSDSDDKRSTSPVTRRTKRKSSSPIIRNPRADTSEEEGVESDRRMTLEEAGLAPHQLVSRTTAASGSSSDSEPDDERTTSPATFRKKREPSPLFFGNPTVPPQFDPSDEEEVVEKPKASKSDMMIDDILANLAEGGEEEVEKAPTAESAETIRDGSFDAQEGEGSGSRSKPHKSLNKKDQEQMKRDIERARRERDSTFNRPPAKVLPVTQYMLAAAAVVTQKREDRPAPRPTSKSAKPSQLNRNRRAQSFQPIEVDQETPEEITFFPSSREKGREKESDQDATLVQSREEPERSPTPPLPRSEPSPMPPRPEPKLFVAELSDDDEETQETSVMDMMASVNLEQAAAEAEARKKAEAKGRKAAFEKRKKEAAFQQARRATASQPQSDDSDDMEIVRDSPVKRKPTARLSVSTHHKGPDARAVMNRNPDTVPTNKKNEQLISALSGKTRRAQTEDTTESYVAHAAKTFQHNNEQRANGGAKPAGQKAGKDRVFEKVDLDAMLARNHAAQARSVRERKEQDFGRKRIPDRQEANYEEMAAHAAARAAKVEVMDEGEDEDPEDEDFALSGEESGTEMGDGEQAGDETVEEDAEEEMEVDTKPVPPVEDDDADDEENVPIVKSRKTRRPGRVTFASDDEDEALKPAAAAQAKKGPVGSPESARVPLAELGLGGFENDLNFDGFGDDAMDGGGFSQLFEATQAKSQAGSSKDVFAGMRQDPMALLNAHAVLPKNIISETQAQRDDALVAAEIEEAMEGVPRERTQPKKKYLNDAGFFTQTKPSSQLPTQSRLELAGSSSDLLSFQPQIPYSPTIEDDDERRSDPENGATSRPPSDAASPTQRSTPRLNRLRRRGSDDPTNQPYSFEPTQLSPPTPPPKSAFDIMMAPRRQSPIAKSAPSRSKLVEEQAEESDEDNGWGPIGGGGGGDGEEEEAEDDDAFLPDLVDDQAVDAEEKRKQDALADEKRREIEKQDDAKREEEARKVTEGQHRTKRKGRDFYSDDESDEEGGRRKRMSKAQRRERKMQMADGIETLPGETNAFKFDYEGRHDSDTEGDTDEEEEAPPAADRSPEVRVSYAERSKMLRTVAEINKNPELIHDLDAELGLNDDDDDMVGSGSFTIQRLERKATITINDEDSSSYRAVIREEDTERYAKYVAEESQTNRRGVGVTHASIHTKSIPVGKLSKGDQKYGKRPGFGNRGGGGSGSAGGKLLASKTKSFAS